MTEVYVRDGTNWRQIGIGPTGATGPTGTTGSVTTLNTRVETSSYSVTGSDKVVIMNAVSATCTIPLATAAGTGVYYNVTNVHSTSLAVVDVSSSFSDSLIQNECAMYITNGSSWYVVGH